MALPYRVFCLCLIALSSVLTGDVFAQPQSITGQVYRDENGNAVRDKGEPGIAGVAVSNGVDIVETDSRGRFLLPFDWNRPGHVFVIKPSGMVPVADKHRRLKPYFLYRPDLGDASEQQPSFALRPSDEEQPFKVIVFGDPQPRDMQEFDYMVRDVIDNIVVEKAAFGLVLGDITYDNLSLLKPFAEATAATGHHWFDVVGNHDLDHANPDSPHETATYESVYGPTNYSFDWGSVHFLVLQNVVTERDPATSRNYRGVFTEEALAFAKNDLARVGKDKLVVVAMHCPVVFTENGKKLLQLLDDRPHTFSIAGHGHVQRHYFVGAKHGWRGEKPHHHLMHATISGGIYNGQHDEFGLPHAIMGCGAPNGYSIMTFSGSDYKIEFVPSRMPRDRQMHIVLPTEVQLGETQDTNVLANIYAGSERSRVSMRINDSDKWIEMNRVEQVDPLVAGIAAIESETGTEHTYLKTPTRKPGTSGHLWSAILPDELGVGTHRMEVRTTDMFDQTYRDHVIFRVTE